MLIRILSAFCLFAFCAAKAEEADASVEGISKELARIIKGRGETDPIAGAALAVMIGGRLIYAGAAGCAEFDQNRPRKCRRPLKPTSKLRVASISKMALAMGFATLVDDGRVNLDRDVSDYLGWRLINPSYPDKPITARRLLSHTSSIRDPEEYWVAAPGRFQDLVANSEGIFAPSAGAGAAEANWFKYANINYGILAGVIEGVSRQRFDIFMSDQLFKPNGLDIGYNWSGVSGAARGDGAALPRRSDKEWVAVVDGPAVLADDAPYFLAGEGLDRRGYLARYSPGENPTLFSPQGGLRASVSDLVNLARLLNDFPMLTAPVWRFDEASPNGDTEGGYYEAFGLGVQTIAGNEALLPHDELIGHSGEAYGLYSGAWTLKADASRHRSEDMTFAFVATGVDEVPEKGAHPSFNAIEERLVRLALDAARIGENAQASGPRPFDESADATQDVDAALSAAQSSGKLVLLVLGGNWCHDSRGLAAKFETEPFRSLIEANYQTVWVDVGHRDRNLDIARRFGVDRIVGTPTVIILSPDGALLNSDTVHDWRTADSRTLADAVAYFESFVRTPR